KDEAILKLTEQIKGFMVQINGTNTFEFAQVTAGGVSTLDVDPLTMESKKKKNLYLIGELLDMDGTCGGYNLQWAWCTGYVAGTSVIGYNS
ncbi:NAD(P)/FAD-dependent oxidoreductase, partial [Klebsiella pneumoniae]|uniref:NAD(P)/FAD-dependent oxidoreductase n=1 Tax=Klebsiella pneumoniae TaxID=573 RepID=UPI00163D8377